MSVKRVFIVRHGETDYNAQHRWQGHLDVPLNENGKQQADALATYFADQSIDLIFSSDLKRAYDTAQAIATAKKMDIKKEKRLREVHLGLFQGLTRTQIQEAYPQEAFNWDNDDSFVVPQGESRVQLQNRAYAAWQSLTKSKDAKTIMLVSHGGTIRMLLQKLFPEKVAYIKLKNTSISIIERDEEGNWQPSALNTTPHLE